jgi:hypothetical protein
MAIADSGSFFKQSSENKLKVSREYSKYFNGYKGPRSTNISPSESVDVNESVRNSVFQVKIWSLTRLVACLAIFPAI